MLFERLSDKIYLLIDQAPCEHFTACISKVTFKVDTQTFIWDKTQSDQDLVFFVNGVQFHFAASSYEFISGFYFTNPSRFLFHVGAYLKGFSFGVRVVEPYLKVG